MVHHEMQHASRNTSEHARLAQHLHRLQQAGGSRYAIDDAVSQGSHRRCCAHGMCMHVGGGAARADMCACVRMPTSVP